MDAHMRYRSVSLVLLGGLAVLIGIYLVTSNRDSDVSNDDHAASRTSVEVGSSGANDPADPDSVYDPVRAGDETPPSYRQLLRRDQIAPIYEPAFTAADDADWDPEILIVGVEGPDTAKAYPVSHLNQREMVIDHIDGDPILVSW
jgi:hypothetical protein